MSIKINKSWLSEQTDEVQSVIGMLLEHIKKQDERIAQLEKRNAELEKRLGITPQNSSLPPSTQHPHAKPASNKPKSKRKQGGQKGHKKHQRELVLGDYQMLKRKGIRRHLHLVCLAHLLLTHHSLKAVGAQACQKKEIPLPRFHERITTLRQQIRHDQVMSFTRIIKQKRIRHRIREHLMNI